MLSYLIHVSLRNKYEKDLDDFEFNDEYNVKNVITEYDSTHDYLLTDRSFTHNTYNRFKFLWALSLSAISGLLYICLFYNSSIIHYDFLFNIIKSSNNTLKIDSSSGIGVATHR